MPSGPKLRSAPLDPPFHVVLVEPEIPPNTGAVARTCAATQSPLHLVGKLGFSIDAHAVRRAGVDYWDLVSVHQHEDLERFAQSSEFRPATPRPKAPRMHLFSSAATRSFLEADFQPGDALIFGKESVGLSDAHLAAYPDHVWAIPTLGPVRSLNLSNAVTLVVYEALRQAGALDATFMG